MTPLSVIITIAAYFVILFTVSYIAGRKADNAGFFVGNRKSSWYVVAFAMVGSAISGVTYVSVPGMVAASSFGYLQMVLGFIAGQLIIAYLLVPLFYKMNLVSQYDTEEEAVKAKYRESVDSELMVTVALDRLKSVEADRNYYQNMCNEVSKKVNMVISLYNKVISDVKSVIKNYDYHDIIR